MAIVPDVPHVVVEILVDGHPLTEYLAKDDDDSVNADSTTRYVECMPSSNFAIRTTDTGLGHPHFQGGQAVDIAYYLDGQDVDGTVILTPWPSGHIYLHSSCRYMEGGKWMERDFKFADLVTTEDQAHNKPRPELKHMGTITVMLYHSRATEAPSAARELSSAVRNGHENIHEKHLKGQAISTRTKLGVARSMAHIKSYQTTRLGKAFATFNFRYRSRKDLQILGLIPRSPSPIPLEDRPEESLTREELLQEFRRQKTRREELVAIKRELKRERIEDEDDDDPILISTRPPTKKPKASTSAIESIDLTDD